MRSKRIFGFKHKQDHRAFPFWICKIPPPTTKFPKIPDTKNRKNMYVNDVISDVVCD